MSPPPSYEENVPIQPARNPKGPPPPLPSRPPRPSGTAPSSVASYSNVNSPRISLHPPPTPSSVYGSDVGEDRPQLPPRRPSAASTEGSPALPPRRPSRPGSTVSRPSSTFHQRRSSIESNASVFSATSGVSTASKRRVLAPDYDPSSLPPLPVRRPTEPVEETPRLPLRPTISSPNVPLQQEYGNGQSQPPPLPGRPRLPGRPNAQSARSDTASPPPVPLSSRPNLAGLQASKPKATANGNGNRGDAHNSCLICRDFSAPDNHAAQYPRQSLRSHDIGWLANELCAPFPSVTDKARAIFTWLHHNISYNTQAFFSNNVRGSTPASTLQTGLAVCEGYAALFAALAVAAGVEAIMVTGHGKGIGYDSPSRNNIPPANPTGHAWNAFRLDTGEWKLTDPCWGAGHIRSGTQAYNKSFNAMRFTQSNEDFGIDHFPDKPGYFFRADGRSLTWAEYILSDVDMPKTMGSWESEGWRRLSIEPQAKVLRPGGNDTIRFAFTDVCAHWDNERIGPGKRYLPFLEYQGRGDSKKEQKPFNQDGFNYWLDIPRSELGRPGQEVKIIYMSETDGKDARGLTKEAYERWMAAPVGKSWAWSIICAWKLV
ncbi:hypothetical protein BT63DRAFT_372242 [Microthyrium microscopicum]|uniref:Transglutaminase-like domain-containing protein n=1 Tax=Microthyrium microscopicum TaxID=703497 RepID=A0A6A6UGJ7_9PEZI|nr:hypothetical protein BT63DRAFT_372242 [Microthyrium microscopicum]